MHLPGTRWMLVLTAAAVPLLAVVPATAATSQPVVDGAVQVTSDPMAVRGHATPVVAVHPEDDQIVAVAEGDAYSTQCSLHVSSDAGLSWDEAAAPELPEEWSGCMFSTTGEIADLAFAEDGTLYYALSGFDPATYHQRIHLARSEDLGQTWDTTELPWIEPDLDEGEFGADALPSVAVDPDIPDRVYVAWWSNNGAWNLTDGAAAGKEWCDDLVPRPWLSVSDDGGRTFSDPVDIASGVEGCMTEPYLVTGNDGEIFAFFGENTRSAEDGGDTPPAHLYLSVSRDGGKTFEISPIHTQSGPEPGEPGEEGSDWLSAPAPGIDRQTGDLYVAWEEMGEGVPQILFMRSGDGGERWTDPVKLNDVDPERDWDFTEQFPAMSVAPGGRIDVAWYDWRNDVTFVEGAEEEENSLQDVYLTSSDDGGTTWSENVRVNDRTLDRRYGARSTGFITGPVGLASTEDNAYVAWDDTRNGNVETGTQDIYATRARFAAADDVFGSSGDGGLSGPAWALLGAGGALALGGLALLSATRAARKGPGGDGGREPDASA